MKDIEWIIYWSFYISSTMGEGDTGGILCIKDDSVKLYIPGIAYYTFKIDAIYGTDEAHFILLGLRGETKVTLEVFNDKIIQVVHIPGLYLDRTIFGRKDINKKQKKRLKENGLIYTR